MIVDLHSHTVRCGHARGSMEEYAERALALGIEEFGFSDHSWWMIQHPGQWLAMRREETAEYVADARRMQAKYSRAGERPFKIRLGLEMDYVPTRLAEAREVIEAHDWDYLIGAVHHIGLWAICSANETEHFERYNLDDVYEAYFGLIGQMVRERFCDVIAHLDLPKRFGRKPRGGFLRWVEPLIPAIRSAGMAVEINTSGRDLPVAEFFPDWGIVQALASAGVPLTLGSDAHAPEHVGRYFPEVVRKLRELGVKEIARFEKRKMIMTPVDIPLLSPFSPVQ